MSGASVASADTAAPNRALVTVSIMLATIMQTLDTTIANVALPHMQGSLSATQDQVSWVLTSYIVAAAIMTPPTGFLSGKFGRKNLFMLSIAGFTISSMLCGAAVSLDEIVFFRLLQGMFGAGLVPLSQSVLLDTYPKERHGSAMAMWGMGVMVGPILGPTLGGYLTEYYNWRWVFYINLPLGILALFGVLTFLSDTGRDTVRRFDWFGFTLLSLAIGALQLMLDRGESQDWFASTEIMLELAVSVVSFYMFVVHMFTAKHPFLEPGLFKDKNLLVGLVFIFVVGIILLATLALLPPFLQNLLGFPVLTTGYVLAPRGVGTMIAMMLVGRLIQRLDARLFILSGICLISLSLWQMAQFNMNVSVQTLVVTGIIQGLGLGFVFVPLSTITFATLASKFRTEATSLFSLMRNIGSSIGISIVVTLQAQNMQINHATLGEYATPLNPLLRMPTIGHYWGLHSVPTLAALDAQINRQSALIAYLNDFRFMMLVALLAAPLLLLLKPPKKQQHAAEAHVLD